MSKRKGSRGKPGGRGGKGRSDSRRARSGGSDGSRGGRGRGARFGGAEPKGDRGRGGGRGNGARGGRSPRSAIGYGELDLIMDALRQEPGLGATGLVRQLGLEQDATREVAKVLRELRQVGELIELRPGRYALAGEDGEYPVRIERNDRGDGLVAVFDAQRKLPVDPAHTMGAQHGDEAIAMPDGGGGALIVRITERVGRGLPGALSFRRNVPTFIPDNRREGDMPVANPGDPIVREYQAGDRVVGKLLIDGNGHKSVEILRLLAASSPEIADFELVSLQHDLPGEFPKAAIAEAEGADASFAVEGREDLRQTFIFTIDPETAKDFDDAISIERLPGGGHRVGIHIADVSHFVRPQTALDGEALLRATSIYLVNRVIPMLPEALSNGLCSLVPDEDRYALSVFVDIDRALDVVAVRPAQTLIRSQQRLTYEQALAIIENREGKDRWSEQLVDTVHTCHRLAQQLRKQRVERGALNLFSVERSFVLDADGHPVDIKQESGDVAHQLIEEFMLLANRTISDWLADRGTDQVYRVHAEPDEDRIEFFHQQLERYGIKDQNVFDRQALQNALKRIDKEPPTARLVLNYLCLRCFQKAIYAVRNVGHYALAFDRYVHFTSPIRRYPDLIIHRLVKRELGLKPYQGVEARASHLDAFARQCSNLEQRAEQAERQLKGIKAARYLSDRIGQNFQGVVTGAGPHGVFVQLIETGLDGLVPVSDMGDDYYRFDADRQALVGSQSGRVFGIGLECEVTVVAVDTARAEVTLTFA